MAKRSDFERITNDFYRTFDPKAHAALARVQDPCLYYEPCVGQHDLVNGLAPYGFTCTGFSDIEKDARTLTEDDIGQAEYIISNPPWSRKLLHELIEHFVTLRPTWLLFDANWANTAQSSRFVSDYCTDIVAVGRLKWIPGTNMSGKDDCAWYRFNKKKNITTFIGR